MARRKPGEGQTALVTGASAGIGVDLAACFARDGYDVILTARSESALRDVADKLASEHKVQAHVIAQDLGAYGGGSALAEKIKAASLGVDVVVNNAGYGHAGALTSSDMATQLGMIDLNVRALVELTYIFWDQMLANKRGGVLNVASTAAFQPGPLMANYYASKAYVLSFSEALCARELPLPRPHGLEIPRARRHRQNQACEKRRRSDGVSAGGAHGV
jgi:short-subunit dehydrogenase